MSSVAKIRVAMIGAGNMANRVHYPSLASFDDVEIAAICDVDAARLAQTADKYGVARRYADYRQMVHAVNPDAVYAVGPPHVMYDIWCWCLEQGLNLFIEKPMGITMHQARALLHLAQEHGCITQVGLQRRTCPLAVELRAQCLQRGPIVHAVCTFYKAQTAHYLGARDHMMDDGVHAIDTLRWMCGGDVVQVQSIARRVHTADINFFTALLEFERGATGVLMNSWSSGRRIFRVEMHGPGVCAEAELEDKGRLHLDGDTNGIEYESRAVAGSPEFHVFGGFMAKNREFIDVILSAKRAHSLAGSATGAAIPPSTHLLHGAAQAIPLPSSHFGDAIKTMAVAEQILAQAHLRGV